MKLFARLSLAAGLAFAASAALLAADTTYYVGHQPPKFVNVQFQSDTELETIVGSTNQATGEIHMDLDKLDGSISLSVPVPSLTTGIAMRDEHMKSANWLDASKYPDITFKSKKVKLDTSTNTAQVTGDFSMHGKTKEMTVTATWKAVPKEAAEKAKFPAGEWVKFAAEFEVKLTDFGVAVENGGGKVSDTWKLRLTVFASTEKPVKK
ncbi:MAG: YceI family protein [Planctomycetes bacterium]|nr:YceI family protein [Planctomycetota bacterium]